MVNSFKTTVQKALFFLIQKTGLKEKYIVRETGIPQTTLSFLVRGEIEDPKLSIAYKLAKIFDVPVEFLATANEKDLEQVLSEKKFATETSSAINIPILEWKEVKTWLLNGSEELKDNHSYCVFDGKDTRAFALETMPFMKQYFPQNGALVIIDPSKTELDDGKFFLISLRKNTPTIRQIIKDEDSFYIHSLNREDDFEAFNNNEHLVIGQVVETRVQY